MEGKKLYKVEDGKMIAGVCQGVAEYFNIDVTLVRLIWGIGSIFVGAGIIAYIIAAIVMPKKEGE